MISLYIPEVGDGLAAGIFMHDGTVVQIDCGSQQHAETEFYKSLCQIKPDMFFLSHFHADHYNGLLQAGCSRRSLSIRQVFYPRIPDFAEKNTFFCYIMAMNHWLMGDDSGSMAYDFLRLISSINCESFTYKALREGDTVSVGENQYEVLWPPQTLEKPSTLQVIKTAIEQFDAAVAEDENLRRILEEISESGMVSRYLETEEGVVEPSTSCKNNESPGVLTCLRESAHLQGAVGKANDALRKAANHLSLAFYEDNRFLFMGDLEKTEISCVVSSLIDKKCRHFCVMITPHHGTHWHNQLRNLHTIFAISSVGRRLFRHLSPEYKTISDLCLNTHLNGDVMVHYFLPRRSIPWGPVHCLINGRKSHIL